MKSLTATLALRGPAAAGRAGAAGPIQARSLRRLARQLRGARAQDVRSAAELAQAKTSGQYSFGQEDYPPAIAATGMPESRAQVEQELQQAEVAGQMASDEEDYPPPMMAHSGTAGMQ